MRALLLIAAIALLQSAPAAAHEIRPGYLELTEQSPGRYLLLWKGPVRGTQRLKLNPQFPENCAETQVGSAAMTPGAFVYSSHLACEGGLAGRTITFEGLATTFTDVLVRIESADGAVQSQLVRPKSPSMVVDTTAGSTPVLGYLTLGVEHILLGVDHLLFVLGLMLIVKNRWMLAKTITSFTVAHSITLGIATLGFASAPLEPLNAAIALSILFLGPEIVRSWRGQTSLTIEHPWIVAFAFGLLHGFGFASGLTTMGLPDAVIPLALLLFNVGVEIGQLAFVLLVVLLVRSFRVLEIRWPHWAEVAPGYAVGSLGAFWTIQRTAVLLGVIR